MPAATGRTAAVGRTAAISRVARGVDLTPPDVSQLAANGITDTTATVTFVTNEPATSQLQYDTDSGFGNPTTVTVSATLLSSHSKSLTGLTAGTTYYYRARATDTHSNQSAYTSAATLLTTGGGGGTSWVDVAGNLTGATLGTLSLEATFNSVNIELPFAETTGTVASVTAEFRETLSPSTVRATLPLWPVRPAAAQFAAYGKALLLTAGTSYDVRVTVTDALGGTSVKVGAVTTRAENIADPSTLTATHFVNPATGNDSNAGTSSGAAWKTLAKAIAVVNAATSDMVISLSAHWHARVSTAIKPANGHKATFLGANACVTRDGTTGEMLNVSGQHSVLFSGFASGPTGASGGDLLANGGPVTAVAPWTAVTPDGNGAHVVYKWAGCGLVGPWQMVYSTTLTDTNPHRLVHWKKSTGDIATPGQFATWVYGCAEQQTGFYVDTAAGFTQDIYARFPGDVNPNTYYCVIGGDPNVNPPRGGFWVTGNDVRITRCEARAMDCLACVDAPAQRTIVDNSIAYMCKGGVAYERAVTPNGYPVDGVYQYSRAQDNDVWAADGSGASWNWVKFNGHLAGVASNSNKVGDAAECTGFYGVRAGKRAVIRYNTVDGVFNGIGTFNGSAADRYCGYGRDVHDNIIRHAIDDAFEPEENCINWAIWNNRVEKTFTFFSTGPVHYGPLFIFNNTVWRVGAEGIKDARTAGGFTSLFQKYSGTSVPVSRVYLIGNTMWSDYSDAQGNTTSGGERNAGGTGLSEKLWMRNNILRATKYAYKSQQSTGTPGTAASQWESEDYNHFVTSNASDGLEISGSGSAVDYKTSVAAYRTATGQGAHSNVIGDFVTVAPVDAALNDPTNGDLTLAPGSPFIDAGTPVANIMDLPGVHYSGASPDLGATQT